MREPSAYVLSYKRQYYRSEGNSNRLYIIYRKASTLRLRLVFALPIFPGSHPPSIVGVHELNFCVRDGNRWTLMTINTNSCAEEF